MSFFINNLFYKKIYVICLDIKKNNYTFAIAFRNESMYLITSYYGEMVEWSITTVLKTVVPRGTGGSNPSLSANRLQKDFTIVVILAFKI